MGSIMKWVNGFNRSSEYLFKLEAYLTDCVKTELQRWIGTFGCTRKHPIEDMLAVKRLYHKGHGKQGEQFTLMPWPDDPNIPNEIYMELAHEVSEYFSDFQCLFTLHLDSKHRHLHFMLNSVSYSTGLKFSQGPGDLNRKKVKINHCLRKHGFEVIRAGAEEIRDDTDYSNAEGFDFLEIEESDDSQGHASYNFSDVSDYNFSTNQPTQSIDNPERQYSFDDYSNNPDCPANWDMSYKPYYDDEESEEYAMNNDYIAENPEQDLPEVAPNAGSCLPANNTFEGITFRPELHLQASSNEDLSELQAQALDYQYEVARMGVALATKLRQDGNTEPFCLNPAVYIDITAAPREELAEEADIVDTTLAEGN